MIDKTNFMETLRLVVELTRTSNEPLSKEEVMSHFKDMELTKEQQDMIYQYVLQPKEDGELLEESAVEELQEEPETTEDNGEDQEDARFFAMYQEDVSNLPALSEEEEDILYKRLSEGDASAVQPLADQWLQRVLTIAKKYSEHQVNIEDLVQEGNIGLLSALSHLLGDHEVQDIRGYIKDSIIKGMENYIDETVMERDWESTVVAKATLVHEAIKALTKDLNRAPSKQELSNYTKLSLEEIQDILDLSKKKSEKE